MLAKTIKDRAIQCFGSQLEGQAYADQIKGVNRFRSNTLGQQVYATEVFHIVTRADAALFSVAYRPDHHPIALLRAEQAVQNSVSDQLVELKRSLEESRQNIDAIIKNA